MNLTTFVNFVCGANIWLYILHFTKMAIDMSKLVYKCVKIELV